MKIYALYDKKANYYDENLMFFKDDFKALRTIQSLTKEEKSVLNAYACDYDLFCLGSIDTATGLVTSDIKFVINLDELKHSI